MKPHGRLGQDDGALTPDVRAPEICPPLAPPEGAVFSARQSRTSRVWSLALLAAVAGHGVITACLLVTLHPRHPPEAPGQKAVEMVFESLASRAASTANPASVTPPQEPQSVPAPSPEQAEPLSVPPAANLTHAAQPPEMTLPDEALASPLEAPVTPADAPPVPISCRLRVCPRLLPRRRPLPHMSTGLPLRLLQCSTRRLCHLHPRPVRLRILQRERHLLRLRALLLCNRRRHRWRMWPKGAGRARLPAPHRRRIIPPWPGICTKKEKAWWRSLWQQTGVLPPPD